MDGPTVAGFDCENDCMMEPMQKLERALSFLWIGLFAG